jgi:2-keto-3-deoxy-L-rhamnonate aldolase RhmA
MTVSPHRHLRPHDLKAALRARRPLAATFVKTPLHEQMEVLALSGLDMICLDAEHAAFDRRCLDACLLACRAGGLPSLVRVPALAPVPILQALDMGATGIVVPHVRTAEEAHSLVGMSTFGRGGRGFAGSTRAADYTGKPMAQHLADSAAQTTIVAQLEDAEALDDLDNIMAVDGVDGILIGRVDLAVSLGAAAIDAPEVTDAITRICAAAARHGRAVGMFLPTLAGLEPWRDLGMTFFMIGSDQGFVLNGAKALQDGFHARMPAPTKEAAS